MSQLTLFEQKVTELKRRSRRQQAEFKLHCQLADLLRTLLHPAWRATHLPMGEYRTPATAAKLKRMGVTPGWPDFMFVGPAQSVFWLELKCNRGRLSDEQIEMRAHLMRCRFGYLVTHDLRDAVNTLHDLGILTHAVTV